jgi:hypothetical protein
MWVIYRVIRGVQAERLGSTRRIGLCSRYIAKGFVVHWHCFKYNYGAVKIAEKIGLVKTAEYPVYVFDLQDKQES